MIRTGRFNWVKTHPIAPALEIENRYRDREGLKRFKNRLDVCFLSSTHIAWKVGTTFKIEDQKLIKNNFL